VLEILLTSHSILISEKFHPTLHADIVGWGSTIEAGAKSYRHVPVQIAPPGDVTAVSSVFIFIFYFKKWLISIRLFIKTGDDTETLRKVEASIQANFKNGLPPHLQPEAKTMTYSPGSDQSRIFVTSHSEFLSLHAKDIQHILRDRLILVHGNPFDYGYGWDLESFGRVHDVDMKTTVHGEIVVLFQMYY
jgi:hypothetical protein